MSLKAKRKPLLRLRIALPEITDRLKQICKSENKKHTEQLTDEIFDIIGRMGYAGNGRPINEEPCRCSDNNKQLLGKKKSESKGVQ